MVRDTLLPAGREQLRAELSALTEAHSKALQKAIYILMSTEDATTYDQQRLRMVEIQCLLEYREPLALARGTK
jgi:hypothetical protein